MSKGKNMPTLRMIRKNTERQKAIYALEEIIHEGDTLYTLMRHVAPSGMSRRISVFAIKNNEPLILDHLIAKALDWKNSPKGGIVVTGAGMDMGFHIVYSLSCQLFCPEKYNHDKAYSLKNRWL